MQITSVKISTWTKGIRVKRTLKLQRTNLKLWLDFEMISSITVKTIKIWLNQRWPSWKRKWAWRKLIAMDPLAAITKDKLESLMLISIKWKDSFKISLTYFIKCKIACKKWDQLQGMLKTWLPDSDKNKKSLNEASTVKFKISTTFIPRSIALISMALGTTIIISVMSSSLKVSQVTKLSLVSFDNWSSSPVPFNYKIMAEISAEDPIRFVYNVTPKTKILQGKSAIPSAFHYSPQEKIEVPLL